MKNYRYKIAYYDEDGKRRGKTFTAPTKRLAELKAAQWESDRQKPKRPDMTVLECVRRYIELKEPVLSPATIRAYLGIMKSMDGSRIDLPLRSLSPQDVQLWINDLTAAGKSPKTIANHFGLLRASVQAQADFSFSTVKLPQKIRYIGHTPSDAEIKALIDYARDTSRDLYLAILLAAIGCMRRSELCALDSTDISGNTIRVFKAKVKDRYGNWVIKTTKTVESKRIVDLPDYVIREMDGIQGPIISCTPNALCHQFNKAVKHIGADFRFHDLRHFAASIMHSLGIPDVYIRQRGGWASDYVMKRVYIDALEEERKKQTDKIFEHFASL